jgi:hypothetical protein
MAERTTAVEAPRAGESARPTLAATTGEGTRCASEHGNLAACPGVKAIVMVCVCRRVTDVVRQMLDRSSLVIVGGQRRTWWPSPEQRLVHRLVGEGYLVLFAQVGARPSHGPVPIVEVRS